MHEIGFIDKLIVAFDTGLQTICPPQKRNSVRASPAINQKTPSLSATETKHIAGLMRINHAGEVCAQALYQGQALTARDPIIKQQLTQSAQEEIDHLAWCEERLTELHSHISFFNLYWYCGSFLIGATTGLLGDKWSLGFVGQNGIKSRFVI